MAQLVPNDLNFRKIMHNPVNLQCTCNAPERWTGIFSDARSRRGQNGANGLNLRGRLIQQSMAMGTVYQTEMTPLDCAAAPDSAFRPVPVFLRIKLPEALRETKVQAKINLHNMSGTFLDHLFILYFLPCLGPDADLP